jgi:hypothetical protein
MNSSRLRAVGASIAGLALVTTGSVGQTQLPPAASAASTGSALTPQQLDQLVAPVALYADPLLADVLTASTYPLELVEAERWASDPASARLKGDGLATALSGEPWDPSVKALVPFPQVLRMMDDHLDWTQRLGETFLVQQADVMDAVQRLRRRAQSTGQLKSSPQEVVGSDAENVTILPPPSQVIYVPSYDPWCVYGPWASPVAPPYYYSPWSGSCNGADYAVGFEAGIVLPFGYWEWGSFDWRNRDIRIDRGRYDQFRSGHQPTDGVWRHDPTHRGGVPYRDQRNAQQFQPDRNYQQSFRGYAGRDGQPAQAGRPVYQSFGAGRAIQAQSQRGQVSRQGMVGGASRGGGALRGGAGARGAGGGGGRAGGGGGGGGRR